MKYIDLQIAFELEINKFDDALTKPKSEDTEYWLNIGLDKFVKTRYSGINYKGEGYNQSQKRTDDLRMVTVTKDYLSTDELVTKTTVTTGDKYVITLPTDYLLTLGEDVNITSTLDSWPKVNDVAIIKHEPVIESTIENVTEKLTNSLSEYRLHANNAKPIRVYTDNSIILYTDGQYTISNYTLTYLKYPVKIDIHTKPFDLYSSMPEHTHIEIVKLAAQAYLENQTNQRYNSYSNEVSTME